MLSTKRLCLPRYNKLRVEHVGPRTSALGRDQPPRPTAAGVPQDPEPRCRSSERLECNGEPSLGQKRTFGASADFVN